MSREATVQAQPTPTSHPLSQGSILQRKCAYCGQHKTGRGTCVKCQSKNGAKPLQKLPTIQAKLTVGQPNDKYEQEADRVAEQIMRIPAARTMGDARTQFRPPIVQRMCANCEEKEKLQTKEMPGSMPEVTSAITSRIQSLQGSGQPLTASARSFFEPRFGHDFSHVRVHTDKSARDLNALAYTVGRNIVFGTGQYAPGTTEGKRLLAHELTHVLQQRTQANANLSTSSTSNLDGGSEHKLESIATKAALPQTQTLLSSPIQLQRQFLAPPPQSGGFSGVMERDRRRTFSRPRRLHFYHGTSWNIARRIIGNVQPRGGGDFAAGFYTHYDRDNSRAMDRARRWGVITALRQSPPERYAGVIDFEVRSDDFHHLLGPSRSRHFNLHSLDQQDYQERQREWLDFVTSYGRETEPTFRPNRRGSGGKWAHERRDPQPHLRYNIITGPFYAPIRGTADRVPARDEFQPYAEGRNLPQQVVWANDGIRLLNSNRVNTRLYQFDARTGDPVDPIQEAFTPAISPPTRDVDVLLEV
ncbi:MAG: DUF4157 domain-containing protein [Cyanobacteria bacterium P01_F01_bin.86]